MDNNKIVMSSDEALKWVDRAIDLGKTDIAIDMLKDLLKQAIEYGDSWRKKAEANN